MQEEFECNGCDRKTTKPNDDNWFIDKGIYMGCRVLKQLFHLCGKCRSKNAKKYYIGETKCERCYCSGEWGEGKWNDNHGHVQCSGCGNLCYWCHEKLHYNK